MSSVSDARDNSSPPQVLSAVAADVPADCPPTRTAASDRKGQPQHYRGVPVRIGSFHALLAYWDLVAWFVASFAVVLGRYDLELSNVQWNLTTLYAALSALLLIAVGWLGKLYSGRYRVATFDETLGLAPIVLSVGWVVGLAMVIVGHLPRGLALLVPPVAFTVMEAGRFAYRSWRSRTRAAQPRTHHVLIYGAGDAGSALVRLIETDQLSPYRVVGLIDDDKSKRYLRVMGVPVVGTGRDILAAAERREADTVILAIANANGRFIGELQDKVEGAGLQFLALAPLSQIYSGRIGMNDVKPVSIEDVLGRRPIKTDVAAIAGYLTGKRVLITGAGGSIGSELARQVHKFGPAELALLDRDESGLHGTQLSIYGKGLLDTPDMVLCDIRDREALRAVFDRHRPEVVFHAAALKHLPMLEQYPDEGWKTNVLGTRNVLDCAQEFGVSCFVNISTDKAADPISVLGRTKRLAERLTSWYAEEHDLRYMSVRFGNVLGSRGSVLHTFRTQIAAGGPVTVTHPDIERYFMTIAEACELVIQAGAIGEPGDVLVLDMGVPVKILDVAKRMVSQSDRDIQIVFTGLRPGEKMTEVLFNEGEVGTPTTHPLIRQVPVPPLAPEELDSEDFAASASREAVRAD